MIASRLNTCGIVVVVLGCLVFQYLLLSLFLFARVNTDLFQTATHDILFPAPPPPPVLDPLAFSCSACSQFDFLGTRAFSCESCNASSPAAPPPDPSEADRITDRRLFDARRSVIDNYYDHDTFLFKGATCSAYDPRHCQVAFTDHLLGAVLDMERVSVHPVAVLCIFLLLVLTTVEIMYVRHQFQVERARVDTIVAQRIIQQVGLAHQHSDFKDAVPAELPLTSLFDEPKLFGIPQLRHTPTQS